MHGRSARTGRHQFGESATALRRAKTAKSQVFQEQVVGAPLRAGQLGLTAQCQLSLNTPSLTRAFPTRAIRALCVCVCVDAFRLVRLDGRYSQTAERAELFPVERLKSLSDLRCFTVEREAVYENFHYCHVICHSSMKIAPSLILNEASSAFTCYTVHPRGAQLEAIVKL